MGSVEKPVRIEDIMEGLGVSKSTVERWVKQGLPVCKPGGLIFFLWSDVSEWMQKHKRGNDDTDNG